MVSFLWLAFETTCHSFLSIPVLLLCLWLGIIDNHLQREAQLVLHPISLCYFVLWMHILWHFFLQLPGFLSSACSAHQSWDITSLSGVIWCFLLLFPIACPLGVQHLFQASDAGLQFLVIERHQGSSNEWRWTLTNYSTPLHIKLSIYGGTPYENFT